MRLISGFGINDAAYFVAPRGQPPCRFYKRWGKLFEANCGGVYLGKFDTELEAHNAWRLAKSTQIYEAISDYPDLDPRVTSRMIEKAIEFGR